jgi:hypothetical protein
MSEAVYERITPWLYLQLNWFPFWRLATGIMAAEGRADVERRQQASLAVWE